MPNIKKRSDKLEEFSHTKIEKSIKNAGADQKTAQKISEGITYKEGMKTSDIRKQVIEKLTHQDEKISKAYDTFNKPATVKK